MKLVAARQAAIDLYLEPEIVLRRRRMLVTEAAFSACYSDSAPEGDEEHTNASSEHQNLVPAPTQKTVVEILVTECDEEHTNGSSEHQNLVPAPSRQVEVEDSMHLEVENSSSATLIQRQHPYPHIRVSSSSSSGKEACPHIHVSSSSQVVGEAAVAETVVEILVTECDEEHANASSEHQNLVPAFSRQVPVKDSMNLEVDISPGDVGDVIVRTAILSSIPEHVSVKDTMNLEVENSNHVVTTVAPPSSSSQVLPQGCTFATCRHHADCVCHCLLPRPHVEKMLLTSYLGLFPLEVECEDDSSDDELASAKEWWAQDFDDAFQLCPEVERDDFVNSWAEPLVYGCFPEMCQNLFSMSECEREPQELREGATELLGRLSERVRDGGISRAVVCNGSSGGWHLSVA